MSTLGTNDIPFEVYHEKEHLRLLELPPAILELVTSKRISSLTLKSGFPNLPKDTSQKATDAVLCSEDKTYQVRQVQSSNSVFILQPTVVVHNSRDQSVLSSSLSAIAQCAIILELVSLSPAVISSLKTLIPAWEGPESAVMDDRENLSKQSIINAIASSRGEIDQAMDELCVFEMDERVWLPTTTALGSVWKSIMQACTLRGINVDHQFELATLVDVIEEDGHPLALVRAVIDALKVGTRPVPVQFVSLSSERAVPWIGGVLLDMKHNTAREISITDFQVHWADHLPETWKHYAKIEMLKGKYTYVSGDTISTATAVDVVNGQNNTKASSLDSKSTRKWHEKFKR